MDEAIEHRLRVHATQVLPFADLVLDEAVPKPVVELITMSASEMQRYRAKTQHALLILCLHIGNDPPDFVRIEPCAKLECWTDPLVAQAKFVARGSEGIADTLEQQYRSLQKDAMYKKVYEATIDEAKQQMQSMRKKAKDGRVLVHYNGHGMPRATHLGEIWFFDKDKTHYVPFNVSDMAKALSSGDNGPDSPNLFVMDCNSAGSLLGFWQRENLATRRPKDMFICACGEGELLPMNPLLPADILTSSLTTPLRMALEWYTSYSFRKSLLPQVTEEMVRSVPGELGERKTPLGELNWILTAVMDTIAWCTTSPAQFHQIFRQDVLVKSLFRNFILADKILREVGCTPVTLPQLPETTHAHAMWEAWEAALEGVLCQLPSMLNSDLTINTNYIYRPSTFWCDQLTAFEVWVEGGDMSELPEQLPCVILALTQVSQRVRALTLLARYLHSGPVACHNVVLCGIIPYISKLTVSNPEVFFILCIVWLQITRHDPTTACVELGRANVDRSLIRLLHLDSAKVCFLDEGTPVPIPHTAGSAPSLADTYSYYTIDNIGVDRCKTVGCYILCRMMECGGEKLQLSCWNNSILKAVFPLLFSTKADSDLKSWGCLLLAKMFSCLRHAKEFMSKEYASRVELFVDLITDKSPTVRSSAVTLLGSIAGVRFDLLPPADQEKRAQAEKSIVIRLRDAMHDHSSSVREEAVVACSRLLHFYGQLSESYVPGSGTNHLLHPEKILAQGGSGAAEFALHEPQLKVRSLLTASRPTTNAALDDTFLVSTSVLLSKDDPAPPPWDKSKIAAPVLKLVNDILHDASLMLATLHDHCDRFLVSTLLSKFTSASEDMPQSSRVATEGDKTMQSVDVNHVRHLTEIERSRNTRNSDLMRQHCLDIISRKPAELAKTTQIVAQAGNSTGSATALAATESKPPFSVIALPSLSDGVQSLFTAAQFRLLEPHIFLADRHKVSVFDYESSSLRMQMAHGLDAQVKDMHIVNDLAEHPAVLLLDRRGCFTLYSNLLHGNERPRQASSFSCTNRIVSSIDLVTGYRQLDGTVFFAGPIGDEQATRNQIALFSLVKEQIYHALQFAGDAPMLSMHPHNRGLFAGFADGIVRHYDDRSNTGNMAQLSIVRAGSGPQEPILSVGVFDSDPDTLYTSSGTALRIFDVRQTSKPKKVVEFSSTRIGQPQSPGSPSASFSIHGPQGSIGSFGLGIYTNLCSLVGTDGQVDILNHKCESVVPKAVRLPLFQQTAVSPASGLPHPIKQLFFGGNDLLWVK